MARRPRRHRPPRPTSPKRPKTSPPRTPPSRPAKGPRWSPSKPSARSEITRRRIAKCDRPRGARPIGGCRMLEFQFQEMFPLGPDETPYRQLTSDHVGTASLDGERVLTVAPEALTRLAAEAFHDISHLLRPSHLKQLRAILDDPESSANDKFVALDMLKNANIAAGGVLPMCQDTGTAIVFARKGQRVWTKGGQD